MAQDGQQARKPTVLVVDDELYIRRALGRVLARQGYRVLDAGGGQEALEVAEQEHIDIALVDLKMPGMSGHEVLGELKRVTPRTECIMMTAYSTPEDAFQALHAGAYDYFEKPIEDWVRFNQILRKALNMQALKMDMSALKDERDSLVEQLVQERGPDQLIGNSPAMIRLKALIRDAARYPVTVLITGESGSGKERVARAVHNNSPRASQPFVGVNCGALPEDLIEAELFGSVPGGFTGAVERAGRFRQANGGTLLLDEIGDLDLSLQVKLLRVLQEKVVTPVGSDRAVPVDVRLVAATHVDLEEAVRQGRFRQDLYFRINVMQVRVPPLRERKEDIPLLAWFFLNRFSREYDTPIQRVDPEAMRILSEHDWGNNNVRELQNVIQRAVISARGGELEPRHFSGLRRGGQVLSEVVTGPGPEPRFEPSLLDLDYARAKEQVVEEFSRWYLQSRLRETGWNITRAAEMSGQHRPNFKKLMKRYDVEKPSAEELSLKLKG